jgi:DNA-binding NarL/FixJ family response regulator
MVRHRVIWAGADLAASQVKILVVDDYEPFREFLCSTLRERPQFHIVAQASDGLNAIRQAEELRPDLLLLDIGLPMLNGIEAARQIRKIVLNAKIVFVSQESSADVVEEAFRVGARGYIVKTDSGRELLTGVDAVLRGETFASTALRTRLC